MIATKHNTTGSCQRCGKVKPFVLATAFDGLGGFRFLCSACDRIEKDLHQLRLFATPQEAVQSWQEPEDEPEPEVIAKPSLHKTIKLIQILDSRDKG